MLYNSGYKTEIIYLGIMIVRYWAAYPPKYPNPPPLILLITLGWGGKRISHPGISIFHCSPKFVCRFINIAKLQYNGIAFIEEDTFPADLRNCARSPFYLYFHK